MKQAQPTAAFLITGNEILSGRTKDKNLGYLAEKMTEIGIRLAEVRVVPDVEAEIIAAVQALSDRYDYVFTSGGIGPTHDDITAACVAKAFGTELERNAEAEQRLVEQYEGTDKLNEARLRMADLPPGATLIDNPVSGAPGFTLRNVHVMAGVPPIFQAMVDFILPMLKGGPKMLSRNVVTNLTEGDIAVPLAEIQAAHAEVQIGSYPFIRHGTLGVNLVVRGQDDVVLDACEAEVRALITRQGGKLLDEAV